MSSRRTNKQTARNIYTGNSDLHKMTVMQLRKKLNDQNVVFDKSDKKAVLVDLCIQNDLLPRKTTEETVAAEDNSLASLTKTVSELQKTVLSLSGNVNRLIQNNQGNNVSSSVESTETANGSDNAPFSPVLAGLNQSSMEQNTNGLSKFGYAAESLPFIETIHPTVKKQILEGKDVNLASLLIPYYTELHSDSSTTVSHKQKPDPRLNHNLSLGQFIQAFGIYKNIMCDSYPARRQELDLYERDIVDMATTYHGKGFYEYHKAFSAQAAAHLRFSNKKVDWSVRNNKLFASIFVNQSANLCSLCQSAMHLSPFCPNQLNKGTMQNALNRTYSPTVDVRGRARVKFNGQEICNNFNSVKGCNRPNCKNAHVCLTCKKEHSQQSCHNAKNSPTSNANLQK